MIYDDMDELKPDTMTEHEWMSENENKVLRKYNQQLIDDLTAARKKLAALEQYRQRDQLAQRVLKAEADLAAARALLQRLIDANPRYAADERLQLDLEAALAGKDAP